MKTLATLLAVIITVSSARAEDTLMEGGRSPNRHYEVRVSRESDEGDRLLKRAATSYAIRIHEAGRSKPVHTLARWGHLHYSAALERCRALWHSSSQFAVVSDQPARHYQEIYVIDVSTKHVRHLELPDYLQNALGRVNSTEVDFACVSTPKRWEGDDLIVELYFTANGRHTYTCDVTLHLYHEQDSTPHMWLKHVTNPKVGEG